MCHRNIMTTKRKNLSCVVEIKSCVCVCLSFCRKSFYFWLVVYNTTYTYTYTIHTHNSFDSNASNTLNTEMQDLDTPKRFPKQYGKLTLMKKLTLKMVMNCCSNNNNNNNNGNLKTTQTK